MNQPVDGCDGYSLVGEDFAPCTEWLVGSDRKASVFIAPCDKFEENRAFGVVFLGICDVVQNEEIEFVEFGQCRFQHEISPGGLKFLHKIGCPSVQHPLSSLDQSMSYGAKNMRLARAGQASNTLPVFRVLRFGFAIRFILEQGRLSKLSPALFTPGLCI